MLLLDKTKGESVPDVTYSRPICYYVYTIKDHEAIDYSNYVERTINYLSRKS